MMPDDYGLDFAERMRDHLEPPNPFESDDELQVTEL